MYKLKTGLLLACLLCFISLAQAKKNPNRGNTATNNNTQNNSAQTVTLRSDCSTGIASFEQGIRRQGSEFIPINNVKARLNLNGDGWWDGSDGKYVVPNVPPGQREVSSIYAGAVWLGGVDPGGNLKVAAKTYGFTNDTDFWPGPLKEDDLTTELNESGTTDSKTCNDWSKFFEVYGDEIDLHLQNLQKAELDPDFDYTAEMVPANILGWPAAGNSYFFDLHGFELPNQVQGLGSFYDADGSLDYDPLLGDYPVIEIRGCNDNPQYPDQMIFWVYNDNGNIHTESEGNALQMEIQVQAFSYATNDEVNNMTFQRYKLINRATEDVRETFFAMWVDPDLGCYEDDFIGCDTSRSMAYVYNQDEVDGISGCECDGVNTYCNDIPILGVDYFRGPLDENGDELGMSSFTYYNNGGIGQPDPGTTDPGIAQEYYNYLSGKWRDGTPFTYGGDAYNPTGSEFINFAFTDNPNDNDGWSMCTEDLPFGDRRTVQASGPFILQPGAVNELIIGVVWIPEVDYPCPNISELQFADDIAQALFDNCFEINDGPDAPDLDWIELDRELICLLSNDSLASNNYNEYYEAIDFKAPDQVDGVMLTDEQKSYKFEGYKVYQIVNENINADDFDDPSLARVVFNVDVKNGVTSIFNWTPLEDPVSGETLWRPEVKVEGTDQGIDHSFKVTIDQFSENVNRSLINHKKYYYKSIAYAYNDFLPYDEPRDLGQRTPYLEGRQNIRTYTVIPRPVVNQVLNVEYGTQAEITRLDGVGAGNNFLKITQATLDKMFGGDFNGEIDYETGFAPITIKVVDPLHIKSGTFVLRILDNDITDDELDNNSAFWVIENEDTGEEVRSNKSLLDLNEQLVADFGFSIVVNQALCETGGNSFTPDLEECVCDCSDANKSNGAIGTELTYADPAGSNWFTAISDGENQFTDFVKTNAGQSEWRLDPTGAMTSVGDGLFYPYKLCDWRGSALAQRYITPAFTNVAQNNNIPNNGMKLADLNNVDIVFTSDKSKWSRCIVLETANVFYTEDSWGEELEVATQLDTFIDEYYNIRQGRITHFDARGVPSVGKEDANKDGLPDPDGQWINDDDEILDPANGDVIDPDDDQPLMGMGWFPGYAIDVETGQRLNIFFGENSSYDDQLVPASEYDDGVMNGRDMMFNPSSQTTIGFGSLDQSLRPYQLYYGGQHHVFVTSEPYDSCQYLYSRFRGDQLNATKKSAGIKQITWTGMPYLNEGAEMLSYDAGLIPNDLRVSLRVNKQYAVETGTGNYDGYPAYRFTFDGVEPTGLDNDSLVNAAMDAINVVPNPYYGFSSYETEPLSTIVKFTNLPAKCIVTIYSLDGKFIRQYNRDETGISNENRTNPPFGESQYTPALEWDLKNNRGIPIASGVYLVHIDAGEMGERVLKWFGISREFNPSGL